MPRFLLPLFLLLVQDAQAQVDTVPPVLMCKNLPLVVLGYDCYRYVNVHELIDTVYDNSQYYELAYRKACTGDGFPDTDSLPFSSSEYGGVKLEIFARDSVGNTSSCMLTMHIYDSGFCDSGSLLDFRTKTGEGIDGVTTHVIGTNCFQDSMDYHIPASFPNWGYSWITWSPGCWMTYGNFMPAAGYAYDIIPSRNNDPLNGVTTYDLVLISKHILGIEPLNSPYKIIAADVNQDGKVTTFDILLLRKLILGSISELPNGKSWRFIPSEYQFPNPQNPFDPPFPDKATVPRSYLFPGGGHFFFGLKIGDVNDTAQPN